MKKIYLTASKNGKEIEKEFSTHERAEADIWDNNYYMGCIVEEEVSDACFDSIVIHEQAEDLDGDEDAELTQFDRYRHHLKSILSACNQHNLSAP